MIVMNKLFYLMEDIAGVLKMKEEKLVTQIIEEISKKEIMDKLLKEADELEEEERLREQEYNDSLSDKIKMCPDCNTPNLYFGKKYEQCSECGYHAVWS